MIRVIGFYRWEEGAEFNHEYYNSKHMTLTKELLVSHGLIRLESDSYISDKPPFEGEIIATSNAYFRDLLAAQTAMASVGEALMEDVPKYTTLAPEIRITNVTSHAL